MIGGMSWESTLEYYRLVNEEVKKKLGGLHSAECVLYSVDFAPVEAFQQAGDWEKAAAVMVDASQRVKKAGADFLVICTNTMHKLVPQILAGVDLPILHIADATAQVIKEKGLLTVGLLGTRFTMEQDFYRGRLQDLHGLKVLTPNESGRDFVHRVIYDELCQGVIDPRSNEGYRKEIDQLAEQGAEGVILGCTEIGLLVKQADSTLPLFDTTQIHAQAAVGYALGQLDDSILTFP